MILDKTISYIFLVPTLGISLKDKDENNLINAFIKDENREINYENSLYLLFKPTNIEKFRDFLQREKERTDKLIDDYDIDNGYVIVVYKLDEKYQNDINLIKEGKYSKTSQEFQNLFPRVKKIVTPTGLRRDEISLQYRIFNRTPDLIEYWEKEFGMQFTDDMEVWEKWNDKTEILKAELLSKLS